MKEPRVPSQSASAPKRTRSRTPVQRLHVLRPRRRDLPWAEQAAMQVGPEHLPLDLRLALAVTHALSQELDAATEEHQNRHRADPYRVDLFEALGQRLGIRERTLRRIHGGHRWVTVPEVALLLADDSVGPRLTERLRVLDVDLLATRPNLSRGGGPLESTGTVEDMENDGYSLLEQDVRERVRVLASWQARAAANQVATGSLIDWLTVEATLTLERTPTPRTTTAPEQLRSVGLSLAEVVRGVLAEQDGPCTVSHLLAEVRVNVRKAQVDNGLDQETVTRHQITDALKYLRSRGEVRSHEGQHSLTEGTTQKP